MKNVIATHKLELVHPNGGRTPVQIVISSPYSEPAIDDPSYTCWVIPVAVHGIRDKVHYIPGDDPFETIVLGIMFVKRMLVYKMKEGCRIVIPETDDDYPIEEIFESGNYNPDAHEF